MPEFTSPKITSHWSRSISLRVFCTPVPTSLAESSTRSCTWRPRIPPFWFTSSTAYLAPSTSLCAKAERIPVSGSTIPIFTGVSPRALMIHGEASCAIPSVAPDRSTVRRPTPEVVLIRQLPIGHTRPCTCGPRGTTAGRQSVFCRKYWLGQPWRRSADRYEDVLIETRLLRSPAAVHNQGSPSHQRRSVRGQEYHRSHQVLDRAQPPELDPPHHLGVDTPV